MCCTHGYIRWPGRPVTSVRPLVSNSRPNVQANTTHGTNLVSFSPTRTDTTLCRTAVYNVYVSRMSFWCMVRKESKVALLFGRSSPVFMLHQPVPFFRRHLRNQLFGTARLSIEISAGTFSLSAKQTDRIKRSDKNQQKCIKNR